MRQRGYQIPAALTVWTFFCHYLTFGLANAVVCHFAPLKTRLKLGCIVLQVILEGMATGGKAVRISELMAKVKRENAPVAPATPEKREE